MSIQEPLRFDPLYFQKVWGGGGLAPFLRRGLPALERVGEVWDVVDRDDAGSRVVSDGACAGRSLRELMAEAPRALLGEVAPAAGGYFPLLVKHIDAGENLSVQVHPDARTAARLGDGAAGKDEAWYVLSARPESRIWLGVRPDVRPEELDAKGTTPEVLDLLREFPVHAGQFFFVPAGTVHAIGAGIVLVEVQQNSDTTYRLFDWQREDATGRSRTLHREQALASIVSGSAPEPVRARPRTGAPQVLVEADPFTLFCTRLETPRSATSGARPRVLVVLSGRGELRVPDCAGAWAVEPGDAWLVPAAVERHELVPDVGGLDLLEVEAR